MHEYSLVKTLMARVEQEARQRGAVAVRRVSMKVGELSGVDPELLATAFDTSKPGTLCAAATLEVRYVKVRWACRGCGTVIAAGEVLRCPSCGGAARLVDGNEMLLETMDLEVP